MRIARKIMLLALTAMAAMAFAASSASATDPVTYTDEATGAACNPCSFHVDAESHLARLDTGTIVLKCQDEYHIDLHSNGTGEVEWVGINHPVVGPGCNTQNCTIMSRHWRIHKSEEDTGRIELHYELCFRNAAGGESECQVIAYATHLGNHAYGITASQICPASGIRIELTAATEATEGFEATH